MNFYPLQIAAMSNQVLFQCNAITAAGLILVFVLPVKQVPGGADLRWLSQQVKQNKKASMMNADFADGSEDALAFLNRAEFGCRAYRDGRKPAVDVLIAAANIF